MTKDELIQYSAKEVRSDAHLYTEFLRIFQDEYGRGCAGCQFKTTFSSWQRAGESIQKNNTMSQNTFILKEPNARFRVNESEILSSKASDEIALKWLSLKDYGGNPTKVENLEKVFKKLPEGYGDSATDFSKLKKAELHKVATENNYPEEEWKSLNIEPLREYISAKTSEVKDSAEEISETDTINGSDTTTETE